MFETLLWWQILIYIVLVVWSIIWKGIALWRSARKNDMAWFVVLFLVSTIGILEILYIFVFSKPHKKELKKKRR
jgi:hypothetical protein